MQFDLLIKNGQVVDPGGNQMGRLDVAVNGERIAAVDANIPAESAAQVIDASGKYVTPGLVDLHTHVYHGVTYWGIRADPVAARSGVTTWLDVGSAGGYNMIGFRNWIANPALARIYALINISSIGLTASTWELANLNYCDVDLCTTLMRHDPELIKGVKVRMDVNTTGGGNMEPMRRARRAADEVGLPIMVHIGGGPPTIQEILTELRPGDIITHCFTGNNMRILDDQGKLFPAVKALWDQGVVLDIGHGAGSFSFETAEAMAAQGYQPDVISSDIHQLAINGPMYDMPTCLSKMMATGMSFADVIRAATLRPAQVMGLADQVGSLEVGKLADIALFTIEEGSFPLYDIHMNRRDARQLVRNSLTILGGQVLERQAEDAPAPWMKLSQNQQNLIEWGHTPNQLAASAHPGSGGSCC